MAASVIDVLELIEVDEADCTLGLVRRARRDFAFEFRGQAVTAEEARQDIVVGQMNEVLLALLERLERIVERRHNGLRFLVVRGRELHTKLAGCNLIERLLKLGERSQRPLQETTSTRPRQKEQRAKHDAREDEASLKRAFLRCVVEIDSNESQQFDRGLRVGRIESEETVARERFGPDRGP